jgi:hypothetical protein
VDTELVTGPNEERVRRAFEVVNRSEGSVDAVMAGLEELMHPNIEFVNP